VEVAEGVHEPRAQQLAEAAALLRRGARALHQVLRVRVPDVQVQMRHVQIAAQHLGVKVDDAYIVKSAQGDGV